jgi:transposase
MQNGICPECGTKNSRRHSSYVRKLLDLPWAGIPVRVQLAVKKIHCDNPQCHRKIFAERLGEELKPYARRTGRLNQHLNAIGFALGGNAGSKLSSFIGMPVSSSTLLRVVLNTDDEHVNTPRVLGVDDWAFRKGNRYGTILVDLEKNKPIDLLPDREAATLEKWLKDHPGVEIISRDRASAYSQGAKAGAPDAIQVADRWHLLKNLGDALKKMLDRYNKELRLAAEDIAKTERKKEMEAKKNDKKLNTPVRKKAANIKKDNGIAESKFKLNFKEVKRLRKEGASIKSIHRQTGLHRQTIKRYLQYDEYPTPSRHNLNKEVADFEDYVRKRWTQGERNVKQIWREIKEQGFTGSFQKIYRVTKDYPRDPDKENLPPPLKIQAWSARKVSILLRKEIDSLEKDEQIYLKAFMKHCPKATEANSLALQFKEMTDKLKVSLLDPWIEKAQNCGITALKNFASGLKQDYDAVRAAVSLEWSNGQVEGQVNRLKMIKRQMYGRASFELLRKRVLMDSS